MRESMSDGPKRIALLNPPSFFLTDDKVFFSLGLLSIAAVAMKAGHDVLLYDLAGCKDYEARAQAIAGEHFDLYGITATSPQFCYATNVQASIRAAHPHARVVIGGPHATMFASLRKRRLAQGQTEGEIYAHDVNFHSLEAFDQIIEGEEPGILEALKEVNNKHPPRWVYAGLLDNLDELPFLPRGLIDMNSYLYKDDGTPKFEINGGPATSILSQRGCPFGCNFCSGRNIPQYRFIKNPATGKIRAYSPERIVAELNDINQKHNVTGFMFYDDELNLEVRTTQAIAEALERNNEQRSREGLPPYSFRGFVKSELLVKHPEIVPALKRAGFNILLSGFESGSDRILKGYVKKNTTRDINYRAAELAFQNGIQMKALTMVGHPTETLEDVRMTESFLNALGELAQRHRIPWEFDMTILTPYPGSRVYDDLTTNQGDHREEFQRVLGDGELYVRAVDFSRESTPYKTAPGENVVLVRTESLSSNDFLDLRQEIDDKIRTRYDLHRYDRDDPRRDIEHDMGQSI